MISDGNEQSDWSVWGIKLEVHITFQKVPNFQEKQFALV